MLRGLKAVTKTGPLSFIADPCKQYPIPEQITACNATNSFLVNSLITYTQVLVEFMAQVDSSVTLHAAIKMFNLDILYENHHSCLPNYIKFLV